jgi:hypothetical protein
VKVDSCEDGFKRFCFAACSSFDGQKQEVSDTTRSKKSIFFIFFFVKNYCAKYKKKSK